MPNLDPQTCWESWVERHLNSLLLYARNQTVAEGDAEDLVQQALVEAWQHGEPTLALAFTIIRRRAIDLGRSTLSRRRRERDLWQMSPEWLEPEITGRDDAALVAKELARLPAPQREVVALHVWGGLNFREVGEVMGTPLHTAASRYRAALAALRPALAELNTPS